LVANDGRPLLPVEEAYAFDRLRKDGERIEDIARKIGRTTTVVSSRLALLKTSPAVKEAVNSGKIGVTLAAKVAKKSEKEQDSLIKKDKGEIKKELGLEHKKFSFPRRQVADEIDGWIEESFLSYDIGNAESLEIVIDDLVIRLEKILKKGI
jgi:predicted DNA-binding transcriptional regulator